MQNTLGPTNNIPRQICIYWAEYYGSQFGPLCAFGPSYRTKELESRRNEKTKALDLVVEKSDCTREELVRKLEDIQEAARQCYAEDPLEKNVDRAEFLEMMAVDGCFLLLIAFSILGMELEFLHNHPIFGIGCVTENMDMWLSSMFFVGNQVPFIVLKELMKLSFFRELKTKNKWKQPLELAKRALYKLLITELDQEPVDLIHCLQSFIPGTKSGTHDVDVPIMDNNAEDDVAIPMRGTNVGDEIEYIPSAKVLFELGVAFGAVEEELGIRGIYYKRSFFNAVFNLSIFKFDKYTELVMECLRKYEIVQRAKGIEPESSSFFKLLSELIRTPQDVEVLSSQGAIQGKPEGFPAYLRNFEDTVSCEHLRHVRREIKENPPRLCLKHKRLISFFSIISAILLLILAFLQTEYSILGFYKEARP